MILTDTHTHLYLHAFDEDREAVIQKAIDEDVRYMLLPNIDSGSFASLVSTCEAFPDNCFPMIGLHPTSVKENFRKELDFVSQNLKDHPIIAIGEIGIDLYWDKTYLKSQVEAFRHQIELALETDLPIVIHSRDSFNEIISVLNDYQNSGLKGVFHCFTGTLEQAGQIIDLGFYMGIGGVVTFKNAGLDKVVREIDLSRIVLETDSPFLAPVPFRGKRNESTYINIIAAKIANIKHIDRETVAEQTTRNAINIFKFTDQ